MKKLNTIVASLVAMLLLLVIGVVGIVGVQKYRDLTATPQSEPVQVVNFADDQLASVSVSDNTQATRGNSEKSADLSLVIDGQKINIDLVEAQIDGRDVTYEQLREAIGPEFLEATEIIVLEGDKEIPLEDAYATFLEGDIEVEGVFNDEEDAKRRKGIWLHFRRFSTRIEWGGGPQAALDDEEQKRVAEYVNLIEELNADYPEPSKIDVEQFVEKEADRLEKILSSYCELSGDDTPCRTQKSMNRNTTRRERLTWWESLLFGVGVIPHYNNSCSGKYDLIQMYHDDEDSSNGNARLGWTGAIVSNANTLYRFCEVDGDLFEELKGESERNRYAVLSLGIFCPDDARVKYHWSDSENRHNNNWKSGAIFPNIQTRNYLLRYCVFDGTGGDMTAMPDLGIPYGVFAPWSFSQRISFGYVYQDNEDFFIPNIWFGGSVSGMMWGNHNTIYMLTRVR